MVARHRYRNDEGGFTMIATVLRWQPSAMSDQAEEGKAATWTAIVDDPDMTLDFKPHRRWTVFEDDSESEDDHIIWDGFVAGQGIAHGGGDILNPDGRVWTLQLVDLNTLWTNRLMTGSDADLPEQTDVERMELLAESEEMGYFDDLTFIAAGSPVDMDERDGRGQYTGQLADECAQDSGKNYWIGSRGIVGEGSELYLWYGKDSLNTYESPLMLSNDPADLDMSAVDDGSATTYPLGADTNLDRDGTRIYSGVYVEYEDGRVYVRDEDTEEQFTLSGRDLSHPAPEIKTKARAKRRARRLLNDHGTQDERITTTVTILGNKVSMIRRGMRIILKATHLPGYESGRYIRILNAQPKPVGRRAGFDVYELRLELQGPGSTASVCSVATTTMGGDPVTVTNTTSGFRPYSSVNGNSGDNIGGDADGLVFYCSAGGGGPRLLPRPGPGTSGWGGWHFRNYGAAVGSMPTGFADGGAAVTNPKLQVMAVGPGEMTIYASSEGNATWTLYAHPADASTFDDDAIPIDSGTMTYPTTVIVVPDDGYCLHSVVVDDESVLNQSMFFGGWDWLAEGD